MFHPNFYGSVYNSLQYGSTIRGQQICRITQTQKDHRTILLYSKIPTKHPAAGQFLILMFTQVKCHALTSYCQHFLCFSYSHIVLDHTFILSTVIEAKGPHENKLSSNHRCPIWQSSASPVNNQWKMSPCIRESVAMD